MQTASCRRLFENLAITSKVSQLLVQWLSRINDCLQSWMLGALNSLPHRQNCPRQTPLENFHAELSGNRVWETLADRNHAVSACFEPNHHDRAACVYCDLRSLLNKHIWVAGAGRSSWLSYLQVPSLRKIGEDFHPASYSSTIALSCWSDSKWWRSRLCWPNISESALSSGLHLAGNPLRLAQDKILFSLGYWSSLQAVASACAYRWA